MIQPDILNAILDGDCTLFAGAGFSFGSKNIIGGDVPMSSQLSDLLYSECSIESDGDLNMAVISFVDRFGEDRLSSFLRQLFYISSATESQAYLSNLRWKSIYTSNYDNLLETCLTNEGKLANTTGIDSSPSFYRDREKLIVHVNGSIEDLKEGEPIPTSFKLTDVSYSTTDFLQSAWHSQLKLDLTSAKYTIFIGSSLRSDIDLKRLLQPKNEDGPRNKVIFIVKNGEAPTVVRNLEFYGKVYQVGTDGLAELLKAHSISYIPRQRNKVTFFSFHRYSEPKKTKFADSSDAFALLFGGKINPEIFYHSVHQPDSNPYYFHREAVSQIFRGIKNGDKNILVISDIGNGKSIVVEALALKLAADDYQVFRFDKAFDSVTSEIEEINRCSRPVIIVESFAQNRELLYNFQMLRSNKDLVLILTERTALYETSIPTIENLSRPTDFVLHDVNYLDVSDISGLTRILDMFGLWGDDGGLSSIEKQKLIKQTCHANIREILIRILESELMVKKFSAIIDALRTKKHFNAIVLILTANRYNIALDVDYVNQVLNTQNIRDVNFSNNLAIKELLDFQHGEVKIKSAIVSEFLLEKVSDVKPLVDALVMICKTVDEWEDDISRNIMREYVGYGNLKWLCTRDGINHNDVIYYFFEEVRNLSSYRNNHHYWLQYAILDIEREEFDLAHQHINYSYALAKKKRQNLDTYQIDNQFANLLLKELISKEQLDVSDVMGRFKDAHRLLTRATDPNRLRHYPYKVAEHYATFYNKYWGLLDDGQKESLLFHFEDMIRRMGEYLEQVTHYREKRFVTRVQKDLKDIVDTSKKSKSKGK
ncbi:MAG: hypothetical protein EOO15_13640 [Chitinophagaceae bacterium]|nr:MAG: hypothetical protein EOO15_13640 [Chitinophagaceae bacterium]